MKYIMFIAQTPYSEYVYSELKGRDDIIWYATPKNRIIKKIRDIHTSIKLNSYFNVPFQSIWYDTLIDKKLNENEEYIFVFEEGNKFSYNLSFLRHIKNKYVRSKFVFRFLNPTSTINSNYIELINDFYDLIVAFDKNDADKYNYCYYNLIYSKQDMGESYRNKKSDIFFVGKEKGRLEEIQRVYHYLKAKDIVCDFYIIDVPKEKINLEDGIHYNEALDYNNAIKHIMGTNCILEVLQDGQVGSTQRVMEAITFSKKLLTSNKMIKNEPYYNPEQIKVYSSLSDISKEFVCTQKEFKYNGCFSPNSFLDYIFSRLME